MKYLSINQLLVIYDEVTAQTGGAKGIRDRGLLESAIARPKATFSKKDLYPNIFLKAAALGHSIISNHPFLDGNKRMGYMAIKIFLNINGYDIEASLNEKYKFVMKIAEKKIKEEAIADWVKKHSLKIRKGG